MAIFIKKNLLKAQTKIKVNQNIFITNINTLVVKKIYIWLILNIININLKIIILVNILKKS